MPDDLPKDLPKDMPTSQGAPAKAVIDHQLSKFKAKFGREPGPDEPLFFDPDADEPRPLTDEQVAQGFDAVIDAVSRAGLDPAFIMAWQELGYLIGTENRHLFSEAEVQAFEDAVVRNRAADPDAGATPSDEGDGGADDAVPEGDDGPGLEGLVLSLADSFEGVVAATLREPGLGPVMNLNARLQKSLTDDEAGELIAAAVLAVLTGWLSAAREHGVEPEPVMDWILLHLGVRDAAKITPVSGLIGYAKAPKISMDAVADQLGPALVPSLLYLTCGVAATAGGNDAHWLRQFDLTDLTV